MPSLKDLARMAAAESGLGGTGMEAAAPMMAPEDTAPEGMEGAGSMDPGADLASGVSMIEGALEALGGELAESGRQHLEALREIAVQAQAAGGEGLEEPPMEALQEPLPAEGSKEDANAGY